MAFLHLYGMLPGLGCGPGLSTPAGLDTSTGLTALSPASSSVPPQPQSSPGAQAAGASRRPRDPPPTPPRIPSALPATWPLPWPGPPVQRDPRSARHQLPGMRGHLGWRTRVATGSPRAPPQGLLSPRLLRTLGPSMVGAGLAPAATTATAGPKMQQREKRHSRLVLLQPPAAHS